MAFRNRDDAEVVDVPTTFVRLLGWGRDRGRNDRSQSCRNTGHRCSQSC